MSTPTPQEMTLDAIRSVPLFASLDDKAATELRDRGTFSYLDRLLTFQQKQAPRNTPSKKLNSGLIVGFVKPKYLTGRLLHA